MRTTGWSWYFWGEQIKVVALHEVYFLGAFDGSEFNDPEIEVVQASELSKRNLG
jgi:hypothetical protein